MKKYKSKIKKIDASLKDSKLKGRDQLLSEVQGLKTKLKLAEDILKRLKSSPPGDFEDVKAISTAMFDQLKKSLQGYSESLSMDPVYRAKDDVVEYSCEKITQVEDCIKKKPLFILPIPFCVF